ncbi:HAMP domain-containing sensor histidine kinase [Nonomuraea sp. NPDC000554]|uniref:sensor histidine kinase n=1 Tax=Nonomuraea sp. NPDC000554 TaxID=3154259 RepID=UPI0033240B8B
MVKRFRILPRSIRARLTTIATLVATLVFTSVSVIVLVTVPANLRGTVGDRVELAVRRTASKAEVGDLPRTLPLAARVRLLQVVSADGKVVASSATTDDSKRLTDFTPRAPEVVYTAERTLPEQPDSETSYLVKAIQVRSPTGPVVVYGAASLADVNTALEWLYVLTFLGTPAMLLIVAGITWTVVDHALRPVERIRANLVEVSGRDLSRRVPVSDIGDEFTELARTINATLDRLERSAEMQRRFVADASHELRSPISALQTEFEFASAYPDETDWPETGAKALAAIGRLTQIIDELLMLARLEAGTVLPRTAVDLSRLADEQARRRVRARVPVIANVVDHAPVFGSPLQLERLMTNLIDNATRHANSRVDVQVRVDGEAGEVILTVTDDGSGIAPEDRERVFQRFVRLDESRARDKGGSGLGLTLCKEIVTSHGGTLTITDHRPGAQFVARLPLYKGPTAP